MFVHIVNGSKTKGFFVVSSTLIDRIYDRSWWDGFLNKFAAKYGHRNRETRSVVFGSANEAKIRSCGGAWCHYCVDALLKYTRPIILVMVCCNRRPVTTIIVSKRNLSYGKRDDIVLPFKASMTRPQCTPPWPLRCQVLLTQNDGKNVQNDWIVCLSSDVTVASSKSDCLQRKWLRFAKIRVD